MNLIGEIIGLARCTDGNEHLINQDATNLILDVLSVTYTGTDEFSEWQKRVELEKRKMIPDCFLCASPCGKNNAYDMDQLIKEPEAVYALKMEMLHIMQSAAAHILTKDRFSIYGSEFERYLYHGLIMIGIEGFSEKQLQAFINQLKQTM